MGNPLYEAWEQEQMKKNTASMLPNRLEAAFNRLSKEATKLVTDLKAKKAEHDNDPTLVLEKVNKAIKDCKDGIKKAYNLIDGR